MRKINQKGFTIIELLVVIVIIGILVALTLPNLFSAQARGRDTDRKNELKNLQTKLETYFGDNDRYPTEATWANDIGATADEITGPRSDAYVYEATPEGCDNNNETCQGYTLTATLENKNDKDAVDADGHYVITGANQ